MRYMKLKNVEYEEAKQLKLSSLNTIEGQKQIDILNYPIVTPS